MEKERISRRNVLKGLGIAALMGAGGVGIPHPLLAAETKDKPPEVAPGLKPPAKWYQKGIIGDPHMDAHLFRCLSAIWGGMGDLGECLDTASRIKAGNDLSWYEEWFGTAERVRAIADNSLKKGRKISAGEAYMRACNYYRSSEFYLHANPQDARILNASKKSVDCFQKAAPLLSIPVQEVRIPYEGTTLPGYFYLAEGGNKKGPILIVHQGFDATAEETYHVCNSAIKRGYHCLIFEGPGQGRALREQGLRFRSDWDKVVTPVVDYVMTRSEIDPGRVALLGISFGGYLTPRAAAFEPRLKICIANPGIYNWDESIQGHIPPAIRNLLEKDPQAYNNAMANIMKKITIFRWFINDGMWKYGADSAADIMMKLRPYTLQNIVQKIRCKTLVMDGTAENLSPGQAKQLYDALTCPKEYMLFTDEDAASTHCQGGAHALSNQRMFDWLDENI